MAAETVDVTANQNAVLDALRTFGTVTDRALVQGYFREQPRRGWPKQSESGIRSRRAELVDAGLVVDTGLRTTLESGRSAVVWGTPIRPALPGTVEPDFSPVPAEPESLFSPEAPARRPSMYDPAD